MGNCFRETGQTRANRSRSFERGSTCHAPKGAAARCCSFKALGRASLSGSGSSLLPFPRPPMPSFFALLKCVGKAVLKAGVNAIPLGGFVAEVAGEAYQEWGKET